MLLIYLTSIPYRARSTAKELFSRKNLRNRVTNPLDPQLSKAPTAVAEAVEPTSSGAVRTAVAPTKEEVRLATEDNPKDKDTKEEEATSTKGEEATSKPHNFSNLLEEDPAEVDTEGTADSTVAAPAWIETAIEVVEEASILNNTSRAVINTTSTVIATHQ